MFPGCRVPEVLQSYLNHSQLSSVAILSSWQQLPSLAAAQLWRMHMCCVALSYGVNCRRGTCFSELSQVVAPCTSAFALTSAQPAPGFKPVTKATPAGSSRPPAAAGAAGHGTARAGAAAAAVGAAAAASSAARQGLFDPTVPGAVVVNGSQWQQGNWMSSKGVPVVPVVSMIEGQQPYVQHNHALAA